MPSHPSIRVGLIGCGTVGRALAELLAREGELIAERTGLDLRLTRVAVRSLDRDRGRAIDRAMLTTDAAGVVGDPDIDIVVEVMGGVDPARSLLLTALEHGKPVITANKELVAAHGAELAAAADAAGVDLLFEAAVAGGIPFIRPLRESLVGEPITRVMGIVNGTTNYILDQMTTHGASYADALAEAQELGYAEADPTADVDGLDAGAKAAIIASIAFGVDVVAGDVPTEGISAIRQSDITFAGRLGYVIKLLAVAESHADGIAVRVFPAMVPADHPLASVHDSFNAVFIEGESVGDLMFYGRGAGGGPTASAVLGDLIDAGMNLGKRTHATIGGRAPATLVDAADLHSEFYLDLQVDDEPGVLAAVAGVFGRHGVSIRSMEQEGLGAEARLTFITHLAREADLTATIAELAGLDAVEQVGTVLRVVGA